MSYNLPDDVIFQVTVVQLTVSSQLPQKDIHVTVSVGDVSKITCSGEISEDGLTVTWNHPFLFTAPPSTVVEVGIWILPEELTLEWAKQPMGDQIVTNVAILAESENGWQCNMAGQSGGPRTLSMTCKICDVLTVPDGHNCEPALTKMNRKLYEFVFQFKNKSCMSTKTEVDLARLDLCPLGHPYHTGILNDLVCSYDFSYSQEGNISDLNKAVEISQTRLDLCPLGHPEHMQALGWHAICLWKYYCIQRNEADLDRLMETQQRWLDLCPPNHPHYIMALAELSISSMECYYKRGAIADLDRSIELDQRVLDLRSQSDLQYGLSLGNLAISLYARYQRQGNLIDLNRVIDLEEKRLEINPLGHPDHGYALQNLAMSLQDHYKVLQDHSDLLRAISLLKKALTTYSVQHHDFALITGHLAVAILLESRSSHPDPPHTFPEEALETFRLLKKCGPAVSLDLWNAALTWVKTAEQFGHPSAMEAYQTSLKTLDHLTSFNSALDSRLETMQARVADLANNAFSCGIFHGNLQMAIELLEQGRGILWNQLARFDISLAALEGRDNRAHELARKFTQLGANLREHARGGRGKGTVPYWRVQNEWQSVVDKIRRLDGFSRFLLPPRFDGLQKAAEDGPVIIVNASEYNCDALIILHAGSPVHVPLPCSFADVIQLCSQLSELTQCSHAYGDNRESWLKKMLRELWSSVVEPITAALQDEVHLPLGSRIWWCPTSKFTVLPFHAAGPYLKGRTSMLDMYVSSYAPSLSTLLRTRDRARSQRETRRTSGASNAISFVAVGQGKPSADTGLIELPEVKIELDKIRHETNMPRDVQFETVTGDAATIDGAVQAFRDHRWVHVACHGAQHPEKPFESWFAMGDGKLTLMRIIQERYANSEFAFLSACHTALGDASTPDEVLHLAAGMQFAGFNGVIGTLWKVDDSVAHQVVTRFYSEMFKRPVINFEDAAVALNTAVVDSAEDVSLEKRIVFVHIGI